MSTDTHISPEESSPDETAPANQEASAEKSAASGKEAVKKTTAKKKTSTGDTVAPKAATTKKPAAKKAEGTKSAAKKKKASSGKKSAAPKKKSARKSSPAKKKASAGKKAPSESGATGKAAKKPSAEKAADAPPAKKGVSSEDVTRRVTEVLRKRSPKAEVEEEARKGQPVVFTLKDLRDYLATRTSVPGESKEEADERREKASAKAKAADESRAAARPKQKFGAASVADLLGFDPTAGSGADNASNTSEEGVPKKWLPYFRSLVRLHEEVLRGLNRHSEETLRRSSKEESGDLSGYGQHMADAGTESFERDLALSMVSSEQDALYEIDEAIRRIRDGSYGVCEITGKPISRERLRAVPFTRYSVEGQTEVERRRKRSIQQAGIQGFDGEDALGLVDDDGDE
ncbi:MAG: TraR/DksA family transcriptional regulator [Puniceicoccaceae bacterium]